MITLEDMLEDIVQKLRPLVGKNGWDYCVVWKLGDYKSRCIEWMGCCCGGAEKTLEVLAKDMVFQHPCRDMVFQHPRSTLACDALAKLPTSIPLSTGIRGEVLFSGDPRWFSLGSTSNSQPSDVLDPTIGTQVLIPVMGNLGLIELFARKDVPKNLQMIEQIMAQWQCISWGQGPMTAGTSTVTSENQLLEESIHCETPLGDGNPSIRISSTNSDCDDRKDEEETTNALMASGGRSRKSRNLIVERKRREKLSERLLTLRSVVPKITKMDKLSTLGDAILYIEELQKKVKDLQDEVKGIEEEDGNDSNELEIQENSHKRKIAGDETGHLSPSEVKVEDECMQKMEVKAEVTQGSGNEFFLNLFCEKKRHWFTKLMEAINALGLQVKHASVTTFEGKASNIFSIEAPNAVQAEELRGSLLERIRNERVNGLGKSQCERLYRLPL